LTFGEIANWNIKEIMLLLKKKKIRFFKVYFILLITPSLSWEEQTNFIKLFDKGFSLQIKVKL